MSWIAGKNAVCVGYVLRGYVATLYKWSIYSIRRLDLTVIMAKLVVVGTVA